MVQISKMVGVMKMVLERVQSCACVIMANER